MDIREINPASIGAYVIYTETVPSSSVAEIASKIGICNRHLAFWDGASWFTMTGEPIRLRVHANLGPLPSYNQKLRSYIDPTGTVRSVLKNAG